MQPALVPPTDVRIEGRAISTPTEHSRSVAELPPEIVTTAQQYATELPHTDASTIADAYVSSGKVPYQFDSPLLATARAALQRDLTEREKRGMRSVFVRALSDRLVQQGGNPS